MDYQSFITDLHLNLHPDQLEQLSEWYNHSKKVSDFFTLAYYPYQMVSRENGFMEECEIDPKLMQQQWQTITDFLKEKKAEADYISFLGFEWQGTGADGDHNVYFKQEEAPLYLPARYEELHQIYPKDVIAIPHHLAYSLGHRGKNWLTHSEEFSPFAEIYSHHGSSEKDATNLAMERHIHMGPRVDITSVMAGLKEGYHFGIIASGDNHEIPAMVKNGRAGVWATEYTKSAIWEAFLNRRVYGFTDSKIEVWTELGGQPMGSILQLNQQDVEIKANVKGNGKIERIELYQNSELDQVQIVKAASSSEKILRFKFRIECGWGPNVKYFPDRKEKIWQGTVVTSGEILEVEPVFSSFDNACHQESSQQVSFTAKSQKNNGDHWMRDAAMRTEGFIFEIAAEPLSEILITINGKQQSFSVEELLAGSSLIVYEEEAKELLQNHAGVTSYYRSDSWYHNAYKVKIHQAARADMYDIQTTFPIRLTEKENSYFIKVIQADGQTAWSSPIWAAKQ